MQNKTEKKSFLIIVYILVLIALVFEIIRHFLFFNLGVVIFPLFLISSIFISISAVLIRFKIINSQELIKSLRETDLINSNKSTLNPKRFVNLMPIAMIICSIADLCIYLSFLLGIIVFLTAQILLIVALSGIIQINKNMLNANNMKIYLVVTAICFISIVCIIYLFLIYSKDNIMTLFVIPYVIVISIMAWLTYIHLGYVKRSKLFRFFLCIGATFFMISDTMIAINNFNTPIYAAGLWIGATYLLAVFMLQFSVLVLNSHIKNN